MSTADYQYALDLAEQDRNFQNQYDAWASSYPYVGGTSGSEGGGGGGYPTIDWSAVPAAAAIAAQNNSAGPQAYGLQGVQSGATYQYGDEGNAAATLARVRQFDPNATITTEDYVTGGDSPTSARRYVLNFDQSKLPAPVAPGGALVGPYGSNDVYNDDNPNLYYRDPYYGVMTDPRNIRPDTSGNWLDIVGPLAVSAFGFGIPAIAAGLTGGAIGGAAGSVSMPWWGNAGLSTVRQVGSGNINPVNLATTWAPGLGAFGVPPEVAQGLQWGGRAYNAYNAYEQQQPQPQTQLTYNPQNYGNMKQKLVDSGDTTPVAEAYAYSPYYGSRGDKGQ